MAVDAATPLVAATPEATALRMLSAGLWPVPLYARGETPPGRDRPAEGKEPIGAGWGLERNTPETLRGRYVAHPGRGVGVALGPGRAPGGGWLGDIEGDGPEAEESRARLYGGGRVETLGWGSARGGHDVVTLDGGRLGAILGRLGGYEQKGLKAGVYKLPEFPGLEIRVGGFKADGTVKQIQSAFPPTVGTDGRPREWNGVSAIAPAPGAFYEALERAAAHAGPPEAAPGGGPAPRRPRMGPDAERRAAAYLDACDPAVSGQRGHDKAFKAACKAGPGFDLPPETTLRLLREVYNPKCVPPWSEAELRHKVEDAYAEETRRGFLLDAGRNGAHGGGRRGGAGPGDPPPGAPPPRVPVEISPERHVAFAETLALLRNDPDLFRRGTVLVKIADPCRGDIDRLPGGVELRNARGSVRITPLGEAGLSCRLTAVAEFFAFVKDRSGEPIARGVHPPSWLARAVLEHADYPGVRPLEGVAEVPFPRPDGTLVTAPGYDAATGFYYAPSVRIGPIPDRPTREDAAEGARLLLDLVRQFPFATDDDKPVWLAFVLTVIARPAISGPVPGTTFNGNKAGTGKGKLIDAGSGIATGRGVPTTSYPKDEAEAEKIKVAFALSGTPIAHLDNLDEGRSYGGGVIDSALTSTECGGRILGLSKNVEGIVLRTIWCLSGNNISPVKDAFRRWLVCNLATSLERPEERGDIENPDLPAFILAHRAELVRAALVMLRAHAVAGWPTGGWAPLGSYEQWDRIVRGAVWYATGLDCNATRRKAAEDSPDRLNKLALLEAWRDLPGGSTASSGVTSEEAFRVAFGDKEGPATHPELASVLLRFSRDGKVTLRTIGNILRGMKGQIVDGMAFRSDRQVKRSACWYVDTVYPPSPESRKTAMPTRDSGESGVSSECPTNPYNADARQDNTSTHNVREVRNTYRLGTHSTDTSDSPEDCGGCMRLDCPICNPED